MVIKLNKKYNNVKGVFYVPVAWREEFQIEVGDSLGIELVANELIIYKSGGNKVHKQKIYEKGRLTRPKVIRDKLQHQLYNIYILQKDKKILLSPITK
jgi:bifunctional DNA-binding transcriptional regulator/antitoxin component of YhaV-PrlF toxin-antitoxin module